MSTQRSVLALGKCLACLEFMHDETFILKVENHRIFKFSCDFVISEIQLGRLHSRALRT